MLGRLLRHVRAGSAKLVIHKKEFSDIPTTIQVMSRCFRDGCHIPDRYTQYGENLFPAIQWQNLPGETKDTVLIIEDPDAPLPFPFVHAIAYNLGKKTELPEGAIPNKRDLVQNTSIDSFRIGRNTFWNTIYTGPGPVKGHGPHHYYFQVFALDKLLPKCLGTPNRREMIKAMTGHVLAKGCLVGMYEK